MWLNIDDTTGTWQLPIYKGGSSASHIGYSFETSTDGQTVYFQVSDGSNYIKSQGVGIIHDNWYYFVGVVDKPSDRLRIYHNGSEIGSGVDISSLTSIDSDELLEIPRDSYNMDGLLDEVRISGVLRSDSWIETTYNNQSSPSTFHSTPGAGVLERLLRHPDTHAYINPNFNTDRNPHADGYGYTNSYRHTYTHGNSDRDGYGHAVWGDLLVL